MACLRATHELIGSSADDYTATGVEWQRGPGHIYDVLADELLLAAADRVSLDWVGDQVLDAGAGTGAASRAIARTGGRPIALDHAPGMLAAIESRPPSAVADVRQLPIRTDAAAGYVAAFCLNHLADPEGALVDAVRTTRPGGPIVVSAYAHDDHHPVKEAVDVAAAEAGWVRPAWTTAFRTSTAPRMATVEGALDVAASVDLRGAHARPVAVPFPDLDAGDLVAWRLGMAQVAPFVASLALDRRERLVARAHALLGHPDPLVRHMIVLTAVA